jgi:excisionase family DNA binding protein
MATQLLTVIEVADRLGLKASTVRKMLTRGELPTVKPTSRRAVRIREGDVEALIQRGLENFPHGAAEAR